MVSSVRHMRRRRLSSSLYDRLRRPRLPVVIRRREHSLQEVGMVADFCIKESMKAK